MAETNNNAQDIKPLANIDKKDDFVLPLPGIAFFHNGTRVDLRKIDRRAAERLASDPKVRFIKWAEGKGPDAAKASKQPPANSEKGK